MSLKVCLAGAAPDTGNLGVSALCYSALRTIYRNKTSVDVTVFDEGIGCRRAVFDTEGGGHEYRLCGEKLSRRYWQAESLWNIRVSAWLGGLGNESARAIRNSAGVLDVSGGDSFTDLYGPKRFRAVTMLKQIVLENSVPLALLPQTYGPFTDARCRSIARQIVARSSTAWARDRNSFEFMQELLGPEFDPARHQCGVDMAFELERREPRAEITRPVLEWMGTGKVVGINVSGLLFNAKDGGQQQYKLKADYRQVVLQLIKRFLDREDCRVVLIPHVVTPRDHFESDISACEAAAKMTESDQKDRLMVLPACSDPREVKWFISKMGWFCGMRMHSTIAALSTGVPTAALAYSVKTRGVFDVCGQAECVVDPRAMGTEDTLERLWELWLARDAAAVSLAARLPAVKERAREQMELIVQSVGGREKNLAPVWSGQP